MRRRLHCIEPTCDSYPGYADHATYLLLLLLLFLLLFPPPPSGRLNLTSLPPTHLCVSHIQQLFLLSSVACTLQNYEEIVTSVISFSWAHYLGHHKSCTNALRNVALIHRAGRSFDCNKFQTKLNWPPIL